MKNVRFSFWGIFKNDLQNGSHSICLFNKHPSFYHIYIPWSSKGHWWCLYPIAVILLKAEDTDVKKEDSIPQLKTRCILLNKAGQ